MFLREEIIPLLNLEEENGRTQDTGGEVRMGRKEGHPMLAKAAQEWATDY